MRRKLILVEGIPGSGKTSAATFLHDTLAQRGVKTRLFLEGNLDHPADYESVAWFDSKGYAHLLDSFPAQQDLLQHSVTRYGDDHFLAYGKLRHANSLEALPEDLFAALKQAEIYEQPPETYSRLALDQWQRFTRQAVTDDVTGIFECCFLQNPITVLLGRYNLPAEAILSHMLQAAQIIAPLEPQLMYLDPGNVRQTLVDAAANRPQAWLEGVIRYTTGQAFGHANQASGFDGMVRFYETMRDLEHAFLARWNGSTLFLPRSMDWPARYAQITASI